MLFFLIQLPAQTDSILQNKLVMTFKDDITFDINQITHDSINNVVITGFSALDVEFQSNPPTNHVL